MRTIRARFGLKAAFDYVVGEKLINFAEAAFHHPAFAQELPRFISEVRRMFTPEEIAAQLARIEHERNEKDEDVPGEDDLLRESPANIVERAQQFMTIKQLTATARGAASIKNPRFARACQGLSEAARFLVWALRGEYRSCDGRSIGQIAAIHAE